MARGEQQADAAHALFNEKSDEVNKILIDFFESLDCLVFLFRLSIFILRQAACDAKSSNSF